MFPWLESIKKRHRDLSIGITCGPKLSVPHRYVQDFALRTLTELNDIEIHDLWLAGCILHPELWSLQFVRDIDDINIYKERGQALIRKMMASMEDHTLTQPVRQERN